MDGFALKIQIAEGAAKLPRPPAPVSASLCGHFLTAHFHLCINAWGRGGNGFGVCGFSLQVTAPRLHPLPKTI